MTTIEKKSRISRAAEERRAAAERSRRYRASRAENGAPVARDVDAAVSEAMSYWLARRGVDSPLDPRELMQTARIILEREGFEPKPSAHAIATRLSSRSSHALPDYVPSLNLGSVQHIRPTKSGPWKTSMDVIVRLLGR